MSSEQFEEELREVTIVVRSLITSTKPPVSLSNIERDYLNVEMRPIPFRRLGFRNTLELLQETNAFDFQKYGNDVSSSKSTDTQKTATNARALALPLSLSSALSQESFLGASLSCAFGSLCCSHSLSLIQFDSLPQRERRCSLSECVLAVCVCVPAIHGAWLATKGQRVKARRSTVAAQQKV